MACDAVAVGAYTKFIIEPGVSPHTFDASSLRYEILPDPAESFQKHGTLVGGQGITGLLYPLSTRTRQGPYFVYGSFRVQPGPGYFDSLMPYLMGTKDTGIYYPNACPNVFGVLISRDLDVWRYSDCVVDSWELTGRSPEFNSAPEPSLLTLAVNVICKLETWPDTWPSPEPALPTGPQYYPHALWDSAAAFTLSGGAKEIFGFRLKYDNNLRVKFANALPPISIFSTGRKVTLDVILPWQTANTTLYNQGYEGAAASLVFSYTLSAKTYISRFDITNLKVPPESPHVKDENEVGFMLTGRAYGTPTVKEITSTITIPA